jgi:adenine-specific DNA-methyltransferase
MLKLHVNDEEFMLKEAIYKNYLDGKINEYDMIQRLDNIQIKSIKESGVIYTPKEIVDYMIDLAKPQLTETIVEPSCGHGVFVFSLFNYMKHHYDLKGSELYYWFIKHVTCIDLSANTVAELQEMLSIYFEKEMKISVIPNTFTNVKCQDSLFNADRQYDLSIGNPPYVRTKNIESSYLEQLRSRFETCEKGNIDIYYAFVERYFKLSKRICFITPNGFLTNMSGKRLYSLINNNISTLIDFKEKLVFKDARTYTTIFVATRDKIHSGRLYANDINEILEYKENAVHTTTVNVKNIDVLSGLATLADSTYLVKQKNDGKFYATYNDTEYEIEKGILAPYLKITKIKSDQFEHDYMICPYDNNYVIIPEHVMRSKYPMAMIYLDIVKDRLLQRDKGKTSKYDSWYAYGRKQGLYKISSKKVLAVPIMIGHSCIPLELDITTQINEFGRVLFTSGFIVTDNYDSLLTDEFYAFAKSFGKPWPGKDVPYYGITSKHIKSFLNQ